MATRTPARRRRGGLTDGRRRSFSCSRTAPSPRRASRSLLDPTCRCSFGMVVPFRTTFGRESPWVQHLSTGRLPSAMREYPRRSDRQRARDPLPPLLRGGGRGAQLHAGRGAAVRRPAGAQSRDQATRDATGDAAVRPDDPSGDPDAGRRAAARPAPATSSPGTTRSGRMSTCPAAQPTVVDLMSEGRLTATRILDAARLRAPTIDFRGRYTGGTGVALERLATGGLDVVFGRVGWLGSLPMPTIDHVLVRLEPLALLLPAGHPLAAAGRPSRSAACKGSRSMACRSHSDAPEWTDLMRAVLRPVRCALDAAASAGDRARGGGTSPRPTGAPDPGVGRPRRGPRRRPATPGGPGPALRVVDGLAARVGGRGDHGPPRPPRSSSGRPRTGSGPRAIATDDTWLPEPDAVTPRQRRRATGPTEGAMTMAHAGPRARSI